MGTQNFGQFELSRKTTLGSKVDKEFVAMECGKLVIGDHSFNLLSQGKRRSDSGAQIHGLSNSKGNCVTLKTSKKDYQLCNHDKSLLHRVKEAAEFEQKRFDEFVADQKPCRMPVDFSQASDWYFSVRKEKCFEFQ